MNKSSKKLHPRDSPYASLMHPARHPGFPASFFPEQIRSPSAAFPLTPALACVLLPSRSLGRAAPRGGGGLRRAAPAAGEVRHRARMATGARARPDGRSAPRGVEEEVWCPAIGRAWRRALGHAEAEGRCRAASCRAGDDHERRAT